MHEMKAYTNNQIPFKIFNRKFHYLLFICLIIFPRCHTGLPEEKIREADSLLSLTIELQKKISSPEIQMLNDFSYEIEKDLSFFIDTNLHEFPPAIMTKELEAYINLRDDIENCLAACNKYSEEVFLIENNLRDIRDELTRKNKNPEELERLIENEKELLDDLMLRIQPNLSILNDHIESYQALKPLMDELKLNLTIK